MKIFEFKYEIELDVHLDLKNTNKESAVLLLPSMKCTRNMLWDEYRFVEFQHKNDIERFNRHYMISINPTKLSQDCQLFQTLLEIPGVKKVSILYHATIGIEKQPESDWKEINEAVKKAFCGFLEI